MTASTAPLLGVNIDHVATLRQARGTAYPDPVEAALVAEAAAFVERVCWEVNCVLPPLPSLVFAGGNLRNFSGACSFCGASLVEIRRVDWLCVLAGTRTESSHAVQGLVARLPRVGFPKSSSPNPATGVASADTPSGGCGISARLEIS